MANPIEFKRAYEQFVEDLDVREVLQIINRFEPGSIPTYAADALHFMCYYGSLDDIKTLIEKYKYPTDTQHRSHAFYWSNNYRYGYWDCNRSDYGYRGTLLHVVCDRYHGTEEEVSSILEYLINEVGLSTDVISEYGDGLPLHVACARHSLDKVKMVSVGCDVNRQDEAGNTPLHIACRNSDTGIVKFLVEERKCVVDHVALNICGIEADTSHSSLYASISLRTSKHAIKSKQCGLTLLNAVTSESNSRTLFEEAFRNKDFDTCLCLMMIGQCDVYTQIDGIDKCDVVYTLLCKFTSEHGIACTRPTSLIEGDTILHVASYDCQSALIKHLIHALDFSPSIANSKQEYPLHIACRTGCSLEVIELLARCDVNRQDEAGNTPLHIACQNGSIDMVGYLVKKKNCDVNVVNDRGELPLHLACKRMYGKEIIQLVSVGCDVNRQDEAGNTPLHMACQNGSTDMVRYLVEEKKCGFNVANNKGELPLHLACKRMYGKEIIQLVSVGRDVNRQDEAGNTPLHMACQNGSTDMVRYLVEEKKCGFNVANNKGELPLHLACKHRYSKTIVRLVSVGCDVNRQDEAGNTPLHMAFQNGSTDIVQYLVEEKKCDVNVANNKGELPLHLACKHMSGKEIVRLVSVGCDVNRQDEAGNTPLHMACQNGSADIVQYLVEERKCGFNVANNKGELPLHLACKRKYGKKIVQLVSVGCDVNRQDEAGNTPLHVACQNLNSESVTFLVKEKKCDVNVANNKGELPLHLACKRMSGKEIVRLVSVGCDVNRQDEAGNTPLHMAFQNGFTDIVQYLVEERKCDFNVVNNKGEFPLHLACKCMYGKKIVRLVSVGCDVNRQDEAGNTPLHMVCQNGSTDIVRYLVEERKCDFNVVNNKGELPLHLACKRMYGKEIVWLVSVGCDVNRQGNTPLHIACQNDSIDTVRYLVKEKKCDVNVANKGEPRCATIPFNAPTSELGSGRTLFEEAFRNNDYDICFCLMVWECDVYTQIDGIDRCDVVYTLLCKFTSEHGIACTRPTSLIEGDTILHVASYNWQSSYSLMKHLIHVIHFDPSKMNSRQEYPLHIACRLGCSLKVMELLGDCDVDHQDIDGNTPLHLVCLHHPMRDDMISWLLGSKDCSVNIVNNANKKAQEILSLESIEEKSCLQNTCVESAAFLYLINTMQRNDFYFLVHNKNNSLHMALRIDDNYLFKMLKSTTNFTDYLSKRNVFGELPLHLAARTHDVGKVKLVSSGCSPNAVTNKGNTALHEVCQTCTDSDQDLEIAKFLCEDLKCNPNLSNLKGEWPLHLACRRGSGRIVEYFLSTLKVDVDVMDNANCTPLMCTPLDNPEIIKHLIESCADPQHLYKTYKEFFSMYSSEEPPSTPLSIIVVGNPSSGKSTLIKALKSEGCQDMVHAEAFTAGIIPSAYESESFGSIIWYDLAGQSEYYASHEAILHTILSASPPLILLLVDIRKDLEYIQQDVLYWLNFLHHQSPSESVGTRPHLVVVFSFADLSPTVDSEDKIKHVRQNLASDFCKFQLEPVSLIALDCRMPNSDKMVSLRSQLSISFKELCGIAKMNFILHCFYAFLLGNFKSIPAITVSKVLALSEEWIKSGIDPLSLTESGEEASSDSEGSDDIYYVCDPEFEPEFEEESPAKLLPSGQSDILTLCEELSNKGHIILIKHKSRIEKSWLIIHKEMILNEVNGSLFAPQQFRQHCKSLSTSTGVMTYSNLAKLFPHYNTDMLIGFLTQLEFCQEIDDEVILQLLTDRDLRSPGSRFFFFPGLVRIEKPENIWKDDGVYSNACGWIIETTRANEFFTPRFLQVLQLRIAFKFPLSVVPRRKIGFSLEPLTIQRRCSVWKNGISWKTRSGLECLVEVTEQCQAVVLMLQSISSSQDLTSHYISYRSSLIKEITSAVSDICPSLEVSESFCHPDHIQYPPRSCEDTALYSLPSIAHTICKQVRLVLCDNSEHDSIKLEKLVTFEPFFHFNIHQLFNSPEKDNVITDDYLRRVSKSICSNEAGRTVYMMFTQEQNIPADLKLSADAIFEVLVDWRDSKHATYSDLHCRLSQYSIFCDRDPQVRMEC